MPPIPIPTLHLFPELHQALAAFLRELPAELWERPTIAGSWRVKDVAAHLLDGQLRALSMSRDGYFGEPFSGAGGYRGLVEFLNGLNADWVKACRRLSPALLVDLLEFSGPRYIAHLESLPPFEPALLSVAWAGEAESQNWFHIAREYTEGWHHQQQIRLAAGQGREQMLLQSRYYTPYLETSMRALPHHYREVEAAVGTSLSIRVGNIGAWGLRKEQHGWVLLPGEELPAVVDSAVYLPAEIAWRVFTKGISREEALAAIRVEGSEALGRHLLSMLAVMA